MIMWFESEADMVLVAQFRLHGYDSHISYSTSKLTDCLQILSALCCAVVL
jgi:hypothetical protein